MVIDSQRISTWIDVSSFNTLMCTFQLMLIVLSMNKDFTRYKNPFSKRTLVGMITKKCIIKMWKNYNVCESESLKVKTSFLEKGHFKRHVWIVQIVSIVEQGLLKRSVSHIFTACMLLVFNHLHWWDVAWLSCRFMDISICVNMWPFIKYISIHRYKSISVVLNIWLFNKLNLERFCIIIRWFLHPYEAQMILWSKFMRHKYARMAPQYCTPQYEIH